MKKKDIKNNQAVSLMSADTPFAIRESFTQLRTNLMYSFSWDNNCPVVGITSVNESSGKSTVITNLAVSFAQMGKKVLLVDGDMRCPTVHRYFNVDPQVPGLSELISGIQDDVVQENIVPNLNLITSGRIPPNPSELLASEKLKAILAEWKNNYDVIFFDFPPIELIADALILCKEIDGYIFNIRSGRNHNAKEVKLALESMEQVGAKVVGIVLDDYNIKGLGGRYGAGKSKYGKYGKYSKYAASQDYEQSYVKQKADTEQK